MHSQAKLTQFSLTSFGGFWIIYSRISELNLGCCLRVSAIFLYSYSSGMSGEKTSSLESSGSMFEIVSVNFWADLAMIENFFRMLLKIRCIREYYAKTDLSSSGNSVLSRLSWYSKHFAKPLSLYIIWKNRNAFLTTDRLCFGFVSP